MVALLAVSLAVWVLAIQEGCTVCIVPDEPFKEIRNSSEEVQKLIKLITTGAQKGMIRTTRAEAWESWYVLQERSEQEHNALAGADLSQFSCFESLSLALLFMMYKIAGSPSFKIYLRFPTALSLLSCPKSHAKLERLSRVAPYKIREMP